MNLDVNPLSALQSLVIAVVIAVVMFAAGAVPFYFIGKAHGREEKAESVGALKTSVDSCNAVTAEARKAAETARQSSDDLNARLDGAIAAGLQDAVRLGAKRSAVLTTPLRGNTECERTANMIADQFRRVP